LAEGFRSVSFQSATNRARRGVGMIECKSVMAELVAVFSVLLFADRAPEGSVSDTAVDESRRIPLIARKRDERGTPQTDQGTSRRYCPAFTRSNFQGLTRGTVPVTSGGITT
jgi:hypothetical protein